MLEDAFGLARECGRPPGRRSAHARESEERRSADVAAVRPLGDPALYVKWRCWTEDRNFPGDADILAMGPFTAAAPRPPSLRVVTSSIGPASLASGDSIHIRVVVHNDGDAAATTSGPAPGTRFPEAIHRPDDTCGTWHIGVDYDGDPDQDQFGDHRWRWGFGSPIAGGSDGVAEGDIVLATPGTRTYFAGIVQDCVAWAPMRDPATAATVTVR